jgi:hypothetical protein
MWDQGDPTVDGIQPYPTEAWRYTFAGIVTDEAAAMVGWTRATSTASMSARWSLWLRATRDPATHAVRRSRR